MQHKDIERLHHIVQFAEKAMTLADGLDIDDLVDDERTALALTRLLELVGEAASQVQAETRTRHPGLPWASMIGMRNKLIHAYFYVDLRVILETIQDDLPPLIDQIKDILKAH